MDWFRRRDERSVGLLRLWIVLSGFWMVALLTRLLDHPSREATWCTALSNKWIWAGLLAPPIILAAIIMTIHWTPAIPRRFDRSARNPGDGD